MLVGASQDAFDHSMCWHPSCAFPERSASGRVDVPSRLSIQEAARGERETGTLIGSDKVEGTAVYGRDGQKIGSVERVMIDKMSDAYAVLGYGGFFGIGDDRYPTPGAV